MRRIVLIILLLAGCCWGANTYVVGGGVSAADVNGGGYDQTDYAGTFAAVFGANGAPLLSPTNVYYDYVSASTTRLYLATTTGAATGLLVNIADAGGEINGRSKITTVSAGAYIDIANDVPQYMYCTESATKYRCATTHTAGTFADDLAAGKWVSDSSIPFSPAAWSTGRTYDAVDVANAVYVGGYVPIETGFTLANTALGHTLKIIGDTTYQVQPTGSNAWALNMDADGLFVDIQGVDSSGNMLAIDRSGWEVDANNHWPVIQATTTTILSGTAVAGAAATITLASDASTEADFYNGCKIEITGGKGSGQVRNINDYSSGTRICNVTAWDEAPDATSTYTITGWPVASSSLLLFQMASGASSINSCIAMARIKLDCAQIGARLLYGLRIGDNSSDTSSVSARGLKMVANPVAALTAVYTTATVTSPPLGVVPLYRSSTWSNTDFSGYTTIFAGSRFPTPAINCYIHDPADYAGLPTTYGINGISPTHTKNVLIDGYTRGIHSSNISLSGLGNIIIANCTYGIYGAYTDTSAYYSTLSELSFYNNTTDIYFDMASATPTYTKYLDVRDCLFYNSVSGGKHIDSDVTSIDNVFVQTSNCAFNLTGTNRFKAEIVEYEDGNITLTADPFSDAANLKFMLNPNADEFSDLFDWDYLGPVVGWSSPGPEPTMPEPDDVKNTTVYGWNDAKTGTYVGGGGGRTPGIGSGIGR